ncbi:MAG: hypothetical protein GX559_00050 [Candidatus Pacebacteria bacterium]|nr:hypothetical protein [Candidatus Paceibacterota bacterium]
MKKPEMSQRQEMRLELTPYAQMIESAKELAYSIRNLPEEEKVKRMVENYPELDLSVIKSLLER